MTEQSSAQTGGWVGAHHQTQTCCPPDAKKPVAFRSRLCVRTHLLTPAGLPCVGSGRGVHVDVFRQQVFEHRARFARLHVKHELGEPAKKFKQTMQPTSASRLAIQFWIHRLHGTFIPGCCARTYIPYCNSKQMCICNTTHMSLLAMVRKAVLRSVAWRKSPLGNSMMPVPDAFTRMEDNNKWE